jgi:hypothetical protein
LARAQKPTELADAGPKIADTPADFIARKRKKPADPQWIDGLLSVFVH